MLCHGAGLWPGRLLHSSNGAGASRPGLPSRTACLQKDAAGPLPFLRSTDQPLGIKGQERGKERSFTKDDTDRIAGLGLSSGDPTGLQNLHDVQPVWFIFLLTLQQWECWKLSTLSSPWLPLQSLSLPNPPRIEKPSGPPASCQSHTSLLLKLLASCEVQVSAEQYKGSTNTQLNLYLFRDSPLVLSLL